uniref:Uncharacterized protein n=1 Tax=Lotus japonicus TaxID=34305 RepID=I3S686_LOTJA|nr:unknown [Lotus japonicus]
MSLNSKGNCLMPTV